LAGISIKDNMQATAEKELDTLEGIGGKHLAPKKAIDNLLSLLALAVVSGLLAGGGLLGLRMADVGLVGSGEITLPEVIAPTVPQIDISVVDGTNTGLAYSVSRQLSKAGWNVVIGSSLSDAGSSLQAATFTQIIITNERFRADAAGLQAIFPDAPILVFGQFSHPVTVLIGTDYLD
jgi:hypothetical protein